MDVRSTSLTPTIAASAVSIAPIASRRRSRVLTWARNQLLLCVIWSIPGLIVVMSTYVSYAEKNPPLLFTEAFLWKFPQWQVWAIDTPLIIWLSRRFPISRPWPSIPIHLAMNALVATGDAIVYYYATGLAGEYAYIDVPLLQILPLLVLKSTALMLVLYWLVIFADHALRYQVRLRESVAQQARLEAQLVEAQLDALKLQLHPHFLFNTLNAISVLMRKGDAASSVKMLNGLADLLRRSLSRLNVELVPLREELDFIERYLDIETARFPDRLRVTIDVEPAVREARLPNLILQPIVENAIKHGIAPRIRGGSIEIAARARGDRLVIEIRDDGVGLSRERAADANSHGVGLSHVRKRLAQLYPDGHRFTLEPREPAGVVATLEIPLQKEAP